MLRSDASRADGSSLWPGITWSNCIMTSAPRLRSIRMTLSGVKWRREPSRWLWNSTPSSLTSRSAASENTWKPPESVSIGPSHAMKRWRPPSCRTSSSPGRRCRWYAFERTICARIARRSSGSSAFTVASVPTGMNAGDSTAPWGVMKTPARAAPALHSMRKLNGSWCVLVTASRQSSTAATPVTPYASRAQE
jgi:hypothetical protein